MAAEIVVRDPEGQLVTTIRFAHDEKGDIVDVGTFINSGWMRVTAEDAARLRAAAESRGWAVLDAHSPEAFPWYCLSCQRVYRREDWLCWAVYDDDDFHWLDCYRGICPKGHQRMLAD